MKAYEHNERVMSSILDDKAKTLGDKVFVRYREERLTYGDLSVGSNRIANYLRQELGVARQDKIAVMLPNCIDFFYAQFGICKSGGVMVPINVLAKLDLLVHFITNSDARILIIDEQYLPLIQSIARRIPEVKCLIVRTAERKVKMFPFMRRFRVVPFRELFNGSPAPLEPLANWYDPVDIFYTSGTTGVSKGVVLPHNHHYTFGRSIATYSKFGPDDIMYICLPLYHGMASYMSIMPMLLSEGSIALTDRFSASKWLSEIREYGATCMQSVYSMAPILMKQPERPDDADNPLRIYIFSGMPPHMVEPFEKRFGCRAIESYGATESADLAHSIWDERRPGAIGPINSEHYDIKIVNEFDEEVPAGEVGELVSRCRYPYMQMIEYYKMPEATVKVFRNRWLHSGDLLKVDKDGWLYFAGRDKDTIRRRGENISCYELETILASHTDILECAAIPVPSDLGEDDVKVVVAPRPGSGLAFSAIMDFCKQKMASFMVPRYLEIMPEIPKLANEKADKQKLKQEWRSASTWDADKGAFVQVR